MRRFWVVLFLLIPLWPNPAPAVHGMEVRDEIGAVEHEARVAPRPLEPLQLARQLGLGLATPDSRGAGPHPVVARSAAAPLVLAIARHGGRALPLADTLFPVGDRYLPPSTAPPVVV